MPGSCLGCVAHGGESAPKCHLDEVAIRGKEATRDALCDS